MRRVKCDNRALLQCFRSREGCEAVLRKLGEELSGPNRKPVVKGGSLTFETIKKGGVR